MRSITDLEIRRLGRRFVPDASVASSLDLERTGFHDDQAKLRLGFHDTDDRFRDHGVRLALDWPRLPAGTSVQASASRRSETAALTDAPRRAPLIRRRAGG